MCLSAFCAVRILGLERSEGTHSAALFKPQTLLQLEDDIHILNRLAGCAFYQVVNHRKANDFAFHTSYKDMAIVCPCNIFNSRSIFAYLYKWLIVVEIIIQLRPSKVPSWPLPLES